MKAMNDIAHPILADRAREVAYRAHAGQYRNDGVTPYTVHLENVASRSPKDEVSQAVAWLHDAVEMNVLHLADLIEFPTEVQSGVIALTRRQNETYTAYIERIKTTDNGRWVPVKVADLLSNLADTPSRGQIVRYAKALLVLLG